MTTGTLVWVLSRDGQRRMAMGTVSTVKGDLVKVFRFPGWVEMARLQPHRTKGAN